MQGLNKLDGIRINVVKKFPVTMALPPYRYAVSLCHYVKVGSFHSVWWDGLSFLGRLESKQTLHQGTYLGLNTYVEARQNLNQSSLHFSNLERYTNRRAASPSKATVTEVPIPLSVTNLRRLSMHTKRRV